MTEQAIAKTNGNNYEIMERVLMVGDLAQLTAQERVSYYGAVCESVGLNPLTKPFEYISLNRKLTLYATKDAAQQLRKINGVSISQPNIQFDEGLVIVSLNATDKTGRSDSDLGAVSVGNLQGENKANAIMKAITKAKRRVTLSICGLGFLDETEVTAIPGALRVVVEDTGEIIDSGTEEPWTNDVAESQDEAPAPEPVKAQVAEALADDVDHFAAALEADDLKEFAEHAWQCLDGYSDNFHVVGAMTNKWPEAHGQKVFKFTKSKRAEYLQWLADHKAQEAA
jgi:hypothetical protein